jgi:hypothetical protein
MFLDRVLTTQPLGRREFHRIYGEAFPGALFTDRIARFPSSLDRVQCAVTWRAPVM